MRYEIEWTGPALRELRKLDKPVACRVVTAVTKLGLDPRPPGIRALTGYPQGTLRLRIGDYRVVYMLVESLDSDAGVGRAGLPIKLGMLPVWQTEEPSTPWTFIQTVHAAGIRGRAGGVPF